MDTADELIAYAAGHGVTVTARQIEEWNKDGLLPTPTRERTLGQGRGRPKYRYPEPARDAVVWLGIHRRFIHGVDAAKLWMWVEDFAYIGVDVNAVIRGRIIAAWEDVRVKVPSLPDLSEMSRLTEEQREALLDEIDANVTTPMLDGGLPLSEIPKITIGAAVLGIDMGELLSDSPSLGGVPDVDVKRWSDYLVEDGEDPEVARNMVPRMAAVANLPEVFRAASAGTIHPVLLAGFWSMQKRWFPEQQLMRTWKYSVVMLAAMYLAFQRLYLPMYLPMFQGLLQIMAEAIHQDSEIPPRLREKLERLEQELRSPEVQDMIRDIKWTLNADRRLVDQ